MKKLINKIALRLMGMNTEQLTVAERQIVELLVEAKFLTINNNGDIHRKE